MRLTPIPIYVIRLFRQPSLWRVHPNFLHSELREIPPATEINSHRESPILPF